MAKSQVTVRVPEEIKVFAQRVATENGQPLSVVLADALGRWVRWQAMDEFLKEWRAAPSRAIRAMQSGLALLLVAIILCGVSGSL